MTNTTPNVSNTSPSEYRDKPVSDIMQPATVKDQEQETLRVFAAHVRRSVLGAADGQKRMLRLFILALVEAELNSYGYQTEQN